eukprot:scaffold103873_cov53-Prasinocladus_malaysianus.AAC.1
MPHRTTMSRALGRAAQRPAGMGLSARCLAFASLPGIWLCRTLACAPRSHISVAALSPRRPQFGLWSLMQV